MATAQPKPIATRVYAPGAPQPLFEGEEADARAAALKLSVESPSCRYDLRQAPATVTLAQGKSLPNEGGRYERSLAAYQAGCEVPVA